MTRRSQLTALVLFGLAILASTGCELITSVDRSAIGDQSGGMSGTPESGGMSGAAASGGMSGTAENSAGASGTAESSAGASGTAENSAGASGTADNSAGASGTAGACASATCNTAGDCGVSSSACVVKACAGGCCETTPAAFASSCADNGGKWCDGAGVCVACLAPSDCPTPSTACQIATCSAAAHTCGTAPVAVGTACADGGVVCNGNGACVATHCTDGVKDAGESDVDCGGSCGPTCKDSSPQQACTVAGDCVSGVCTGSLCRSPTCSDSVKNGNETDKDCGGPSCAACADQLHCLTNGDCSNGHCFGSGPGTCVSCSDGVKDGNETGVDCGGAVCDGLGKTCAVGLGCGSTSDCTSGAGCAGSVYTPASTCSSQLCVAGVALDCATTASTKACNSALGCVACNAPSDCPVSGSECTVATCTNHACGTQFVTAGVLTAGQTPGDCQKNQCDGAGGIESVDDASDAPAPPCACGGSPLAPVSLSDAGVCGP